MPPSTKAERAEAVRRAALMYASVRQFEDQALARRAELEGLVRRMIDVMGMSRREIGEQLGVSHNTVRSWYENDLERTPPRRKA